MRSSILRTVQQLLCGVLCAFVIIFLYQYFFRNILDTNTPLQMIRMEQNEDLSPANGHISTHSSSQMTKMDEDQNKSKSNSLIFLGQEFCSPPWYGEHCDKNDKEPCTEMSDRCYFNDELGVIAVSCVRWQAAQSAEQTFWNMGFAASDRNNGHEKSFEFYKTLPHRLGDMIELGAGPFTQSQTIFKNSKTALSITLVDPSAFHYIASVSHCFYKNGIFKDVPTTLLSIPVEELNSERQYDTVVMINVIEHAYDALSILTKAFNLIKDGGLFIWHEHLWDDFHCKITHKSDVLFFKLHPVRIRRIIAEHLISLFDTIYVSWDTEELRKTFMKGVYFIGRKKSSNAVSAIPDHPSCLPPSSGNQTVVFFVSNSNYTAVMTHLKVVKDYTYVASVILVLTEKIDSTVMRKIMKYPKIRMSISHHHLTGWSKEVGYYASPCDTIVSTLDPNMLSGTKTICIGSR